jgi:hypothetical protein
MDVADQVDLDHGTIDEETGHRGPRGAFTALGVAG